MCRRKVEKVVGHRAVVKLFCKATIKAMKQKTSKLTWSIHRTKSFFMSAPITLNIKLLQHAEWIVDKLKIHPKPTPLYLSYNE